MAGLRMYGGCYGYGPSVCSGDRRDAGWSPDEDAERGRKMMCKWASTFLGLTWTERKVFRWFYRHCGQDEGHVKKRVFP